jgi:hypothetical protein
VSVLHLFVFRPARGWGPLFVDIDCVPAHLGSGPKIGVLLANYQAFCPQRCASLLQALRNIFLLAGWRVIQSYGLMLINLEHHSERFAEARLLVYH